VGFSEEHWITAAAQGDKEAFAHLVELYHKRVFSVCYRMLGTPTAAEDAAQESFIRAFKAMPTYDPKRSFATWLLSITSHYCIDQLRKRKMQLFSMDNEKYAWLAPPARGPNPEQTTLENEKKDQVQEMLAQLKEVDRAAVILQYWHDYSYQEIAEALDLSLSAVKSRLYRARQQMAEYWEKLNQGPSLNHPTERIAHGSPTV
jgi:RNA polymerase sigma-70 factor (ECF subfamily)